MPSSDSSRDVVLEQLAAEFVERHRQGECPPLSEYTERYPDLAGDIRDLFPALVQIEKLKPASERTGEFERRDAASDARTLDRLGEYRVLRVIGHGGMGVVYEAEQESLGRHVALKVLPTSAHLHPSYLERFRREARAAARLHHTNIVPVFGVGEHDGVPYYAMQFIQGQGLDKVLADVRRLRQQPGETAAQPSEGSVAHSLLTGRFAPPPAADADEPAERPGPSATSGLSAGDTEAEYYRGVARVGVQVAEALAYAHRQGILHRDIKPSNLLLDLQGTVWITDFGLAKAEGADELTQVGEIVGTLRFMAPERFEGKSLPQSDVYALGLTLYELLTQRPAFDDTNKARLIEKVVLDPPVPPRKIDARIPRDLETIVLKCLTKEAAGRYSTAEALAEDLQRFLEDQPIKARRTSWRERTWRWCRRNPVVAGLLVLVTLSLVAGTAVSTLFAVVAAEKAEIAEKERKNAEANARKAEGAEEWAQGLLAGARSAARQADQRAYGSAMLLTQAAWEQHQVDRFLQLLEEQRPRKVGDEDFRGFEWFYWKRQFQRGHLTLRGHTGPVLSVAFSADGKRIASGGGTVKVWDAHTGQELLSLQGANGPVAFSADGKRIASGSGNATSGEVKVRDAHSGQELLSLKGHSEQVLSVAFSADGKRIASGSYDRTVKVWDAQSGQQLLTLKGPGDGVWSVMFSPDSKRIASGSDETVKVWDAHSGQEMLTLQGHTSSVFCVAFSADGKRIASGGHDRTVKVWDAHSGLEVLTLQSHHNSVWSVAFSADGKRIASGSADGTVRVWDAHTGQETLTLKGHIAGVYSVAFSADGKRIASGGGDPGSGISGELNVWDVQTGQEALTLQGHTEGVTSVAFSADGKRIASGSEDKTVKVWDTHTGQETLSLKGHTARVCSVTFSPDGKRIASGSLDKTVKVWDAHSGQQQLTFQGHSDGVNSVAFSADGKRIASGSNDQTVRVWDAHTGQETFTLKGHTDRVRSVAFSADGKRIASGSMDQSMKVWDVQTGQVAFTLKGHTGWVYSVAFSTDGKRIVSGGDDETVRVWDAQTGQEMLTLRGHTDRVESVAFSADGKRIASASDGGMGKYLTPIFRRTSTHRLVSWGYGGMVKVWDARSGQEMLTLQGHTSSVTSVAFSPDGTFLVSGSYDKKVKVWDATPVREDGKPDR